MSIGSICHSELTESKSWGLFRNTKEDVSNYIVPKEPISICTMSTNTLHKIVLVLTYAERVTIVHWPMVPFIPKRINIDDEKEAKIKNMEIKFKYTIVLEKKGNY